MMTFRFPSDEKISRFWQWFEQNAADLLDMARGDEQAARKKIDNRLKSLNRLLVPEVHYDPKTGKAVFVLSADGIEQIFPVVEQVIGAAPDIPGWSFVAFRQPVDVKDVYVFEGHRYNLDDFRIQLEPADDGKVSVNVFVKDYDSYDYYKLLSVMFKIINDLLGEYLTVKKIAGVDIKPGFSQDLPSIATLPGMIDAKA